MKDGIYDTPEYHELQNKENVVDKLIHFSGASSELSTLLVQFYGSDTANIDPGDGGGCASPESTSSLCLSPLHHTAFQKTEMEGAGRQGVRK